MPVESDPPLQIGISMRGHKGRTITYWMSGATVVVLVLTVGIFTNVVREAWFLHQLETGNDAEKVEAMRQLGALGSVRAVPELIRHTEVPNEELRVAAIDALGAIGPGAEAAIPPLVDLLIGAGEIAAAWAASGGQNLSVPPFDRRRIGRVAAVALGRIGTLAVPRLLHELRHGRPVPGYERTRYDPEAIGVAFQTMGEEGFDALMAELRDEDLLYRTRIGEIVVKWDREVLGLLMDALRTGDDYLRAWAVYFLGKLGSAAKPAGPALAMRLTSETEDSEVRCQAGRAILRIESKNPPVPLLVACIDEPDLEVRCVVIEVLGKCGSKAVQAAPRLAQFLTHPDLNVRRTSCDALAEIGVAALPPVLDVLRSEGTRARRWAAHTLWQIGARDVALPGIVAALADRSEVVRMEAGRILDLIGPRAADALRSASSSENRELRIAARRALEARE